MALFTNVLKLDITATFIQVKRAVPGNVSRHKNLIFYKVPSMVLARQTAALPDEDRARPGSWIGPGLILSKYLGAATSFVGLRQMKTREMSRPCQIALWRRTGPG